MMKINKNKIISILLVVVPLLLVILVSLFISTFYIDNIITYSKRATEHSIQERIKSEKSEGETFVKKLSIYLEDKNNKIDKEIKSELKINLDAALKSAKLIHNKYKNNKSKKDVQERIIDSLRQMNLNDNSKHIFIRSFGGQNILSSIPNLKNIDLFEYCDADGRAIILEEITKVRKHNEGYIRTCFTKNGSTQVEMVKDLGFYDWYIGTYIYEIKEKEKKKHETLEMIQNIPMYSSNFMAIYDDKKSIYLSPNINEIFGDKSLNVISASLTDKTFWHKDKVNGYFYFSKYYELLDWHIVYGFNAFDISEQELRKQSSLVMFLNSGLKSNLTIVLFMILIAGGLYAMIFKEIMKTGKDDANRN